MALSHALFFTRANIERAILGCPGVYVFWRGKVCIYVGKTDRPLSLRLREHWAQCHNDELRAWIRAYGSELLFQWECVQDLTAIRKFEQRYIDSFRPLTNKIDSEAK